MAPWLVVALIGLGCYACILVLNVLVCFQAVTAAVDVPHSGEPIPRRQQAYLLFLGVQGAVAFRMSQWAERGLRYEVLLLLGFLAVGVLAFPLYELCERLWDAPAAIAAAVLWITLISTVPIAGLLRPTALRLG